MKGKRLGKRSLAPRRFFTQPQWFNNSSERWWSFTWSPSMNSWTFAENQASVSCYCRLILPSFTPSDTVHTWPQFLLPLRISSLCFCLGWSVRLRGSICCSQFIYTFSGALTPPTSPAPVLLCCLLLVVFLAQSHCQRSSVISNYVVSPVFLWGFFFYYSL